MGCGRQIMRLDDLTRGEGNACFPLNGQGILSALAYLYHVCNTDVMDANDNYVRSGNSALIPALIIPHCLFLYS